jgi:serine/threonine protein phosphatase PrpC
MINEKEKLKIIKILNNPKLKRKNLLILIKKTKYNGKLNLKNIDLIKIIMSFYKIKKSELIDFYSINKLKKILIKNNIDKKYNKNMSRENLLKIYKRLREKLEMKKIYSVFDRAKGRRDYMEDEVFIFDNKFIYFSSVFDGHGGNKCSLYLKKNLFPLFQINILKNKNIKKTLFNTYLQLNKNFLDTNDISGSTCNTLLINKKVNKFYLANVGDSRAIICYKNNKIKQISKDHKPNSPKERKRIEKSGGHIKDNRVNGILAMSRAFGDKNISNYVKPVPDIYEGLIDNTKYILQASDGLFDVMSNQEICSYINQLIRNKIPINKIPYILINYAINTRNSMDNVSVIITFIE